MGLQSLIGLVTNIPVSKYVLRNNLISNCPTFHGKQNIPLVEHHTWDCNSFLLKALRPRWRKLSILNLELPMSVSTVRHTYEKGRSLSIELFWSSTDHRSSTYIWKWMRLDWDSKINEVKTVIHSTIDVEERIFPSNRDCGNWCFG